MTFDVEPSQIESLTSLELVQLLRKLVYTEVGWHNIRQSGVSIPLQITIPDGGKDGKVEWEGAQEKIDYLSSRFCIFQAKASSMAPAEWKKEVWVKSVNAQNNKQLNHAVQEVIKRKGSYIGFTTQNLVKNQLKENRIAAIKEGIQEVQGDLTSIKIDIYGANEIAAWVSKYPAIATWLREIKGGISLKGFQTLSSLENSNAFDSIKWVEEKDSRFNLNIDNDSTKDLLSFYEAKQKILEHLSQQKTYLVQVIGASGLGKTRFVYEIFRESDKNEQLKSVFSSNTMYCDLSSISEKDLLRTLNDLIRDQQDTLLVVDECREHLSQKLYEVVTKRDSKIKVITIGNMDKPLKKEGCLSVFLQEAKSDFIEEIIKQRKKDLRYEEISLIVRVSSGSPRLAVMATDNLSQGHPLLKSTDDVIIKILESCKITDKQQLRTLEYLALFPELGVDENNSDELDYVAERLAKIDPEEMYEHLADAAQSILVRRSGNFFSLQPLPIAIYLGQRRLERLRINKIIEFINQAPLNIQRKLLRQWENFDNSSVVYRLSQKELSWGGFCCSIDNLNTPLGLAYLKAFVHINPDSTADCLDYIYRDISLDDLKENIRDFNELEQIFKKLTSKRYAFYKITKLWLKITAAQENYSQARVLQLFQIFSSGTEVENPIKFDLLQELSQSNDRRILRICVLAFEQTIQRENKGIIPSEIQLGTAPPIKSWQPKTWGEVFDIQTQALQELSRLYLQYPEIQFLIKDRVGHKIRGLMNEYLFPKIKEVSLIFNNDNEPWIEGLGGLNDCLYFDRDKYKDDLLLKIRDLHDQLLPKSLLGRALLYTTGWSGDFNNPDLTYEMDSRNPSYSDQQAEATGIEVSNNEEEMYRVLDGMLTKALNNSFPFTRVLGRNCKNSQKLVSYLIHRLEESHNQFGLPILLGILDGISEDNTVFLADSLKLIEQSKLSSDIKKRVNLSTKLDLNQLKKIIFLLKNKEIRASSCVPLSYGQRLKEFKPQEIEPLLDELENHSTEGLWVALEIIGMYTLHHELLDEILIKKIKVITTSTKILTENQEEKLFSHFFADLIEKIIAQGSMDEMYVIGLIEQTLRLCKIDYFGISLDLRNSLVKVISLLLNGYPSIIWTQVSSFYELATQRERDQLLYLLKISSFLSSEEYAYRSGLLFQLPQENCRQWAMKNPDDLSSFLCSFYPILSDKRNEVLEWHPDLENLTEEFGKYKSFRTGLAYRLYPDSWNDSLIPYLEIYLEPLAKWSENHPIVEMRIWSREIYKNLQKEIKAEKSRKYF